jgi:hypothetical protein
VRLYGRCRRLLLEKVPYLPIDTALNVGQLKVLSRRCREVTLLTWIFDTHVFGTICKTLRVSEGSLKAIHEFGCTKVWIYIFRGNLVHALKPYLSMSSQSQFEEPLEGPASCKVDPHEDFLGPRLDSTPAKDIAALSCLTRYVSEPSDPVRVRAIRLP